jgi:cytochrome c
MLKRILTVLAGLAFFCGAAYAENWTKEDAVKMVEQANAFYKANGREKLLAELNTKNGRFQKGELYVVATDMKGTMLAHPNIPKLVGKNLYDVPDVDGKYFRRENSEVARTKGSGWVDFKFTNPVTGKAEPKTAYIFRAADDLILVCGIYKH